MNNTEKLKKNNFAPLLVALFIFLRAFILSDVRRVGFTNFYPLEVTFTTNVIVLLSLYLAFAVLSALLFAKLEKKFGKEGLFISAFLVAEPFLFVKQENCVNLFVWCIALLFILNALREKPFVPNEITLVAFIIISSVLIKNALYLYVFPALLFYFIPDIDKLFQNMKKLVMMGVSAVSVGIGLALNDYLFKTYPEFDELIKEYSFFRQVYFKDVDYENIMLFVFAVPVLLLGIIFFKDLSQNKTVVSAKAKKNKKTNNTIVTFNSTPAVVAVVIAYIFAVVGFTKAGSEGFYTINYIIPLSVISLLNAENPSAEKSMQNVSGIIEKHLLICVIVLIALFYFAARVFLGEADNLAVFMNMI